MALDSPQLSLGHVVNEEFSKHFLLRFHAQEFGMIAELHVIIGRRSCCATKPKRCLLKHLNKSASRLPGKALQYRRLVQHYTRKVCRVELLNHFIVTDHNRRIAVPRAIVFHSHIQQAPRFFDGLLAHRERRNNQHPARFLNNVPRPFHLHRRLAKSGVREDGRPPSVERPLHQVTLMRKQDWVYIRVAPGNRCGLQLRIS